MQAIAASVQPDSRKVAKVVYAPLLLPGCDAACEDGLAFDY